MSRRYPVLDNHRPWEPENFGTKYDLRTWLNVLQGLDHWRRPPFFYQREVSATLGHPLLSLARRRWWNQDWIVSWFLEWRTVTMQNTTVGKQKWFGYVEWTKESKWFCDQLHVWISFVDLVGVEGEKLNCALRVHLILWKLHNPRRWCIAELYCERFLPLVCPWWLYPLRQCKESGLDFTSTYCTYCSPICKINESTSLRLSVAGSTMTVNWKGRRQQVIGRAGFQISASTTTNTSAPSLPGTANLTRPRTHFLF